MNPTEASSEVFKLKENAILPLNDYTKEYYQIDPKLIAQVVKKIRKNTQ